MIGRIYLWQCNLSVLNILPSQGRVNFYFVKLAKVLIAFEDSNWFPFVQPGSQACKSSSFDYCLSIDIFYETRMRQMLTTSKVFCSIHVRKLGKRSTEKSHDLHSFEGSQITQPINQTYRNQTIFGILSTDSWTFLSLLSHSFFES